MLSSPISTPSNGSPATTISDRKRAANRANAAKSTGPRTPDGKRNASLNALSHGLRARLSQQTLVAADEQEDFTALADALREDLNPQTPLQHLLAERIALLTWKLRRAAAAEAALLDSLTLTRRKNAQERNDQALRRHQRATHRASCDPNHPAPQPPTLEPLPTAAQTLADLASRPNNHNSWLTLHRYEQATQRELHKTLKEYQALQQQHENDQEEDQEHTSEAEVPNEPTAPAQDAPEIESQPPLAPPPESDSPTLHGPNEPTPGAQPTSAFASG